jgi:putative flippase GtrA
MIATAKKAKNWIIDIIDWFHKPFSKYISEETFRYGATGGANTVLDFLLYFVFYRYIFDKQIVNIGPVAIGPHIAAFMFVFPITFTTGFLLAKYITFTQSKLRGRVQIFRYGVSVTGSILLNYFLLKLFVEVCGLYAVLSKILTTIVVVIYSYVAQKHFTFRTGEKALAKLELAEERALSSYE